MELDRPHLRTNSTTSSTNSELFICFASRLSSSSSSMKISKSILSPGRARDPPVSLSTSLSRRLRTNGSIKGGQASPMFPTGGKKRGCTFENAEPSSPKVTCIGQVRVKSKKKAKQTRSLSRRRSGEVSFRKVEQAHDVLSHTEENVHARAPPRYVPSNSSTHFQQPECLPHRNQRWVHLPVTICEALRAFGAEFSCLFPCRSSCFSTNEREKEEKANAAREEAGNGESSCGAVFARWFVALQDCEGRQGRQIELVVGGEDERTEVRERTSMRSSRRHVFEDIEIKEDRIEMKGEGEEEEKARLSICIPPKNALLLMRCRSDSMKMASLTNRFWESKAPKHEGEDEEEDDDEDVDSEDNNEDVKDEGLGYSEIAKDTALGAGMDDLVSERRLSTEVTGELEKGEKVENLGMEMRENEEEKPDEMPHNGGEAEKMQMMKHDSVKNDQFEANCSAVEAHAGRETADTREDIPIQEMREEEGEESSRSCNSSSSQNSDKQILESDEMEKENPESLATETPLEEENEEKAEESTSKEETQEPASESNEERETTTHPNSGQKDTGNQQKEENFAEETAIADVEGDQEIQNLEAVAENQEKSITEPTKNAQERSTSSSNALPDCLLLMMCEPKLSMEVSKETWVCGADFIRWLPERHPKKANVPDELKKRVCKDSNPGHLAQESKTQKQKTQQKQSQQQQHLLQPPRSSCSLPAPAVSMATMIEQKLVNAVGYEPFVLTRCKSEPMRTAAAKLAPDSCFWNNRKLEPHRPATFGVGAAGVGF